MSGLALEKRSIKNTKYGFRTIFGLNEGGMEVGIGNAEGGIKKEREHRRGRWGKGDGGWGTGDWGWGERETGGWGTGD
jgi:hypothetical protein